MATEVEIGNQAMSLIGAASIRGFTKNSEEERQCELIYYATRDALLGRHSWNFAEKRNALEANNEAYVGWDYTYLYPVDCVTAELIFDPSRGSGVTNDWRNEVIYPQAERIRFEVITNSDLNQKRIVTDMADAVLIYTAKVTSVGMFSSTFIEALTFWIASKLAVPLKGDINKMDAYRQMTNGLLAEAKSINSNEAHDILDDSSSFTRSRG